MIWRLLRVYLEINRKHDAAGQYVWSFGYGAGLRGARLRHRSTAEAAVATWVAALPGWLAVFEAKCQSVATFHHFAGEGQVGAILLDLGAGDFDLVVGFEIHAHVVEKFLGTKKYLHGIRAALQHQICHGLATCRRNHL